MRSFLVIVALALLANVAQANLVVTLQEVSGGNVEISWSSDMNMISASDTTGPSQLHFDGLSGSGSPFNVGIANLGGSEFFLSTPLSLSGTPDMGGSSYDNFYDRITLRNNNSKDFRMETFGSSTGLGEDDTYTLSTGSAIVTNLKFSDLNAGTYTSTMGDFGVFGSMTLVISAVPEPSAFLFGTVVCLAGSLRRKR